MRAIRVHREFWLNPMIVFVTAVAAVSLTYALYRYDGPGFWIGLAVGALVYAVMEYLLHRFILHELPRAVPVMYKGHENHHRHPTEAKYLFSMVPYDIGAYAVFVAVLIAATRDAYATVSIVAGASLFQLHYQWMHYVAHRPIKPMTPWGRWMKKKHLLHHYQDERSWYGVSHPVLDIALGTNKPRPRSAANPLADPGANRTLDR